MQVIGRLNFENRTPKYFFMSESNKTVLGRKDVFSGNHMLLLDALIMCEHFGKCCCIACSRSDNPEIKWERSWFWLFVKNLSQIRIVSSKFRVRLLQIFRQDCDPWVIFFWLR